MLKIIVTILVCIFLASIGAIFIVTPKENSFIYLFFVIVIFILLFKLAVKLLQTLEASKNE